MNAETRGTRKADARDDGTVPEPRGGDQSGISIGPLGTVVVCVMLGVLFGLTCRGCYDVTRWLSAKADEARTRADYYEQEVRR